MSKFETLSKWGALYTWIGVHCVQVHSINRSTIHMYRVHSGGLAALDTLGSLGACGCMWEQFGTCVALVTWGAWLNAVHWVHLTTSGTIHGTGINVIRQHYGE